jgi:hypothetical protein
MKHFGGKIALILPPGTECNQSPRGECFDPRPRVAGDVLKKEMANVLWGFKIKFELNLEGAYTDL